jgi:hypothetical protein
MKKSVLMRVTVWFDDDFTDADSLSDALDTLLETSMSTPGILDDYGPVEVGAFVPVAGTEEDD